MFISNLSTMPFSYFSQINRTRGCLENVMMHDPDDCEVLQVVVAPLADIACPIPGQGGCDVMNASSCIAKALNTSSLINMTYHGIPLPMFSPPAEVQMACRFASLIVSNAS